MKILTVIGARPQFIKAAVLSRYIKDNPSLGIEEILVHTGQHYDANMSDVFFEEMQIPRPQYNLHLGSGSHGKMTDALLVYGDTNSTLAGALAASKLHIPVVHVEAGLRSYMMAMPEEQNRRLTDHLSTWLMCPTQTAVDNLKKEGIVHCGKNPTADNKGVYLTGDIMYEASLFYRQNNKAKILTELEGRDFILLTIHRAENTDNPERLTSIVKAINECADKTFVFPVHPRTRNILKNLNLSFGTHVKLIDPIGYFEMIAYEEKCNCILTDSGGVQKEAFFFEKPCITMRDSTEWVELVDSGWNTLVGANTDKIVETLGNVKSPSELPLLYGDGLCAEKICKEIL